MPMQCSKLWCLVRPDSPTLDQVGLALTLGPIVLPSSLPVTSDCVAYFPVQGCFPLDYTNPHCDWVPQERWHWLSPHYKLTTCNDNASRHILFTLESHWEYIDNDSPTRTLQCCNVYIDYMPVYRFLVVRVALDLRKPKGPIVEGEQYGLSFSIGSLIRDNLQFIPSSKWLEMKCEHHLNGSERDCEENAIYEQVSNANIVTRWTSAPSWISEQLIHLVANDPCGSPGWERRYELEVE